MKAIKTEKAPAAIGPYSQGIEVTEQREQSQTCLNSAESRQNSNEVQVNGFVYVSGQLPIDTATGQFPEGIKTQTRQALNNAKAILEAAGLTMSNVVKTTVLLADINDFVAMNEVYAEFFTEPYPARSAFAVKAVPKGALVEIEVIAAR